MVKKCETKRFIDGPRCFPFLCFVIHVFNIYSFLDAWHLFIAYAQTLEVNFTINIKIDIINKNSGFINVIDILLIRTKYYHLKWVLITERIHSSWVGLCFTIEGVIKNGSTFNSQTHRHTGILILELRNRAFNCVHSAT